MKSFIFLIAGFILGCWLSWPGIFSYKNWLCFYNITEKTKKERISLKAVFSASPKYLLKGARKSYLSKLRIVSDACFR